MTMGEWGVSQDEVRLIVGNSQGGGSGMES